VYSEFIYKFEKTTIMNILFYTLSYQNSILKPQLIGIITGVVIIIIIRVAVRQPARELQKKFVSLGNMQGMTKTEIISHCGKFSGISYIEGGTVCVWQRPGYRISLVFDSQDKVVRIASEAAAR